MKKVTLQQRIGRWTGFFVQILSIVLFFVITQFTHAQTLTLPYRRYDVEQGMASSDVFAMTKNREEVLWFATDNGLSRFDGLRFRNYFTENGLVDNMTVAIESLNDTVFISCYRKGIQKFYKNHFDTMVYKTRMNYIQNNNNELIFAFASTLDSSLASFQYQKGAYIKNTSPLLFSPPRSNPTAYYKVKGRFIYKNQTVLREIPKDLEAKNVVCVDEDTEGGVLIGSVGAYYILTRDNQTIKRVIPELKGTRIFKIVKDKYSRVWCKTNTGEAFVDMNGQIKDIKSLLDLDKTVKIRHIFYDEDTDNLWVLTNTNGAYCVYNPFILNYNISNLTNNTISILQFDTQNRLWIGTSGALVVHEKGVFEKVPFPFEANTISRMQFQDNAVYIQTSLKQSSLLENGAFLWFYKNMPIYAHLHLPFSFIDAKNILTAYGDTLKRESNQQLRRFSISRLQDSLLRGFFNTSANRINGFLMRPNDTLWAGGYNGLNWQKGDKWGKVSPNSTILNGIINGVFSLSDGQIVVLAEKGIAIFKNNVWFESESYKGRDVRKSRTLVIDGKGRWWLATANGVLVFEGEKSYFFDKSNGLVNSKVNTLAYDAQNNAMWVGTNNGISRIDITLFEKYIFQKPTIFIDKISGFDGKIYSLSMAKLPTNNLIIHLIAQDYLNPQSLIYEYQLDNNPWTQTDSTLTLPSLSYGNHTIIARAKIENSDWATTDPLSIYVQYPVYMRWWFIGLGLMAASSLVYWRIKQLKKQNEEKLAYQTQITELKQQGLAAMMNPHFIFNSLNSIQYFVNSNDLLQANEYLAQFGKLIRYNLEASMHTTIMLEEELKRLELYLSLEKMRFNFDYTLSVDANLDKNTLEIPSMLIQPFIENAIWHGILPSKKQGEIQVLIVKENDNQLVISIEDNGIGLEESKKLKQSNHIARSLQIINERIHILNKATKVGNAVVFKELKDGEKVAGTLVRIELWQGKF
ncbi:MAG: histidine kinase [Saprospiraceae bacterium]|nr:histidine kinase [Saprospiraceae bacterium]